MSALALARSEAPPAPGRRPSWRPLTLPMRIALGYLHTGPLIRGAGAVWRCREFPEERVLDCTARALEQAGFAALREYRGRHDEARACLVLEDAGRAAYRGGRFAHRTPRPPRAELALCEVERAIGDVDAEAKRLDARTAVLTAGMQAARRMLAEAGRRIERIERDMARLHAERERLESGRADMRAVADHACRQLGLALAEAR